MRDFEKIGRRMGSVDRKMKKWIRGHPLYKVCLNCGTKLPEELDNCWKCAGDKFSEPKRGNVKVTLRKS